VKGRAAYEIRHLITDGDVDRTIQGASTITLRARDRDRSLLRSGYLAKDCDIQIDGLWFRLKSVDKQGDDLPLTFEDREVAVLRTYPKPGAAHNGFRVWDAHKFSRAQVAEALVREAHPELDRCAGVHDRVGHQLAHQEDGYLTVFLATLAQVASNKTPRLGEER